MSSVDLLTQETYEISEEDGAPRKVAGHRYQDFGIHKGNWGRWLLTHLPTGLLVSSGFEAIEHAADAMIATARLRNDWAVIDNDAITEELARKCEAIAHEYGGRLGGGCEWNGPRTPSYNGYSPEA